ncbi:lipid II:glycine glycyltransferase FemX [Hyalangium rubrum]|uniref:GNAT family N-acetyltransferase n=1 Tax=Hyalangium rubrum TaxID=3103134 RepID=A0ABU5H5H7_9BACT|nr:GNAT family N-acetyltransferase [Hyalangium sp. s54d21]MDY7228119.1 GNAT family N-acetyltransferase [Hyalangium sp. s54d21]
MHEIISFSEPERWASAYAQLSLKDVYYLHAYAELCRCMGDGDPFLFAYSDRVGNRVCYAFIRRPIRGLPFFGDARLEGDWYDIISPTYGYGGPLCAEPRELVLRAFRAEFEAYCRGANIVSEFVRFHPLLGNHRHLGGTMDITFDRETVFMDLSLTEEELLDRYHANHQRNIRKALKNGLEFRVLAGPEALEHLEVFYRLYRATMDKLQALPYFYFSTQYLERLFACFGSSALLGAVFLDGRMISAALCLREGDALVYHLGASEEASLHLGPNVFQFHQLALWARRAGLRTFHLGGGHRGRDSLFQFKHRFNPEGTLALNLGRKIHQPAVYARLVESWSRYHAQEFTGAFFPAYRAPPAAIGSITAPAGSCGGSCSA